METIVIYAQSHTSSGFPVPASVLERHYGEDWRGSADLLVLEGSRAELLELASAYAAQRSADGGFAARVARSIRGELGENEEELVSRLTGLRLDDSRVQMELKTCSWHTRWPVVDRNLILTGQVAESGCGEDGFVNYKDEAMIHASEARAGGWIIDSDGYARP